MTVWRRTRLRPLAAALTAAALGAGLLSGCGTLTGGSTDSGPITVMTWAPVKTRATNMPGVTAVAKAFARWVNAEGGVNGRELRVVTCNEGNESVLAARCARRAREEGAVAVVGSYSQHSQVFMASLEADGIPYLGGYGVTEEEFTSPLSYPVNGGQPALLAGSGQQLSEVCERVALVRPDTLAGDELPELFNAGLATGRRSPAADVRVPEDAANYGEEAEQAIRGARGDTPGTPLAPGSGTGGDGTGDGSGTGGGTGGGAGRDETRAACVSAALGGRTGAFLDSFARAGAGGPEVGFASVLGSVQQSLVDRTGGGKGILEGSFVTAWYPPSREPVWDEMKQVIQEHAFGDNRIDAADPGVQTTWVAYTVLRATLESLEGRPVTPRTLQRALDTSPPLTTGGLTPDLGWRYEDLLAARSYPRLVNSMVSFQRVEQGELITTRRDPVDIGPTLERAIAGN
ncbi:ABC transporter substrate-binding protein [Streptomyces sp. 549]|uniref:ABC transporter substrate-binding protein n=1 Tax=Streptomyces sp. 549 TaxID=3049076 RepID=UPI0024C3F6B8|nr:ABC transporter substrate-binding protein [Streptomyces sp. 549]MDK1472561.1 ABC transporter substrate-binding protein [Streptomyces sp. 549]